MGILYRGLFLLTLLALAFQTPAVAAQCDPKEDCRRERLGVPYNSPSCELRKKACQENIQFPTEIIPALDDNPLIQRARELGDAALETAIRNGEELFKNIGENSEKAVRDVLNTADKSVGDTANTYIKAANDTVDGIEAIARFAEREIQGIGTTLSASEERLREGKVVDAIWHLGTDRLSNTEENTQKLAQENEWANLAMQTAASAYGGPAGAAAYAAWYAYRSTDGDFESAVRAGAAAYVLAYGNANVKGMPAGTASEVLKKSAMAGVVGGIAVAASGGTTEESLNAFVQSGGAVLIQSGQAYVNENYVAPAEAEAMSYLQRAKAQADAFCVTVVETSCAEAAEWVEDIRADVESVNNLAYSKPMLVASPDGQWAISWNGQSPPATGVPSVVLTYIGEGSAYRDHLQKITSLTADSVAESAWVAFESSDEAQTFFKYIDGRQVGLPPKVGEVFAADANVRVRQLPNGDTVKSVLDKNSVVTVLEVTSVVVEGVAQEWIRILTDTTDANVVASWIYLGRIQENGSWVLPRSSDLLGLTPGDLAGQTIVLDMAVTVRDGPFTLAGRSPSGGCYEKRSREIGVFSSGSEVKILRVFRFPVCDSFIWAEVEGKWISH